MTFSVLNVNTNEVIRRHNARQDGNPSSPNIRPDPLSTPEGLTSRYIDNDDACLPSNHIEDNN